jgi:hypothetical protein
MRKQEKEKPTHHIDVEISHDNNRRTVSCISLRTKDSRGMVCCCGQTLDVAAAM